MNPIIKYLDPDATEEPRLGCVGNIANYVTERMMDRFMLDDPIKINQGYCFIWAYLFANLVKSSGKKAEYISTDRHVVVRVNGYYYDSCCTDGQENLNDVMSHEGIVFNISNRALCFFWGIAGIYARLFREVIKEVEPENSANPANFGDAKYKKAMRHRGDMYMSDALYLAKKIGIELNDADVGMEEVYEEFC